jgi:hypothetical protein
MRSEYEGKDRREQRHKLIVTLADLDNFKIEILYELEVLLKNLTGVSTKKWLKSTELRKLLGISHCTLQNLRTTGKLPFTKIGGVFYYDSQDVQDMLKKNKIVRGKQQNNGKDNNQ